MTTRTHKTIQRVMRVICAISSFSLFWWLVLMVFWAYVNVRPISPLASTYWFAFSFFGAGCGAEFGGWGIDFKKGQMK